MKKRLLITTALIGVAFSTSAMADEGFQASSGDLLEGIYSGYTNSDSVRAGVVTVAEDVENVTVADDTEFSGNSTTVSAGGVMKLLDSVTMGDNVRFEGNKAEENAWGAGAIYLRDKTGGTTSIGEKAVFTGNSAAMGGALGIEAGNFTLGDGAVFENNTATGEGGAVAVWTDGTSSEAGSIINLGSVTFRNNSSGVHGGAISNLNNATEKTEFGHTVVIGDNSRFEGNSSHAGGAIFGADESVTQLGNNVSFVNNRAEAQVENGAGDAGGAIYLSEATLEAWDNVLFSGNEALSEEYQYSDGSVAKGAAGAIYAYNSNVTLGDGAVFENNKAQYAAGAIYNWLNGGEGKFVLGENAVFRNNESKQSYGGAIGNFYGDMIIGNNASFSGNSAGTEGGAIYNSGNLTLGDAEFLDNTAGTDGGAIYNSGSLTMGDVVFANNKAGGKLNDIYNIGTLDFTGDVTLDGGISGNGTTTFAKDTVLTVKTGTTTISNEVVNEGAELALVFENGYAGGNYELITDEGSLDKEFDIAENALYDIKSTANGSYEITKKSAESISSVTGANNNQMRAIIAITSSSNGSARFNAAANHIGALLQSANPAEVKAGVYAVSALSPEVSPMVIQTQQQTAGQVFGAVSTRLSGGSVATGGEGISSGDSIFEKVTLWIQGMFSKANVDGSAKAKGFDADSAGVAMGVEKHVNDKIKLGVGYAYTNTDIDGFMRDTDVDTHTAILYGEYKPSAWFVNAVATYGWSDYSESKDLAGYGVKADYDVDTIGLQAMTGYEMQVGGYNLTPEAGLRYLHISQDAYTDTADQYISANDSDVLTAVVGAKMSKEYVLENNMVLRPEVRLAVTYDLFNDDASSVVALTNDAAYRVSGEALDRFAVEFGAGLSAGISDNVEVSLSYEGQFRDDYDNHTGLLNAKYKF